ncbi:MAG TPA: DUF6677 family protein [Tepidisphaeraceae bacterium]|nr:DUF6677 family protein [Tepidisphaeraceae bacterium]
MNPLLLAGFGWLVPGGAYLLMRRYLQFGVFAFIVCASFGVGVLLHGASAWPQPAELAGLDGFAAFLFRAGAFAKALTGTPYLVSLISGAPGTFLDGRLHDYGTTLLVMAGGFNVLAISSALDLNKERPQ